jgi:hypothetical protein
VAQAGPGEFGRAAWEYTLGEPFSDAGHATVGPHRFAGPLEGSLTMTTTARQDRRVSTKTTVEHLSVAERVVGGQAVRSDVPRSAHADLDPGPDRADPIARLDRAFAASSAPAPAP